MLAILLIAIIVLFIGIISLVNYHKIHTYHKQYTDKYNTLSKKITGLNDFVVSKFEKNQKINLYLLNNVVEKIDSIKTDNHSHTNDLKSQITKLKQNLKYLMDTSDLYDEFMGSL